MKKAVLVFAMVTGIAWGAAAQTKPYIDNSQSPYAVVRGLGMDQVKWTGGFWKERFDLCQTNVIPAQWDNFMNFSEHNFEIVADKLDDPIGFKGSNWQDGDYYKWLEAQVATYAVTKDPELLKSIEKRALLIARAQAPDGYITMNTQIGFGKRGAGFLDQLKPYKNSVRFVDRQLHETYNMGHLMT